MKKRLLTFILLMLSVLSINARYRDWLTNDDDFKTKHMPAEQKQRVLDNKKKKESEKKAKQDKEQENQKRKKITADREKKAKQDKKKEDQKRKKIAADQKKQVRKEKIKIERQKAKKDKESKPPKVKLTPQAAKMIAEASDAQKKMYEANSDNIEKVIDKQKEKIKHHRKQQKVKAANLTQEASESHLLNVRFAPTKDARDAAEQASCEAHGTCDTAEVQDMLDVIKANKTALTASNNKKEEMNKKARTHSVKAGTMDDRDAQKIKDHARKIAASRKIDYKGDHRLSNTHADVKNHLAALGHYDKKDVKAALDRAQIAMDKAKEAHRKRMAKDDKVRKNTAKKTSKKSNTSSYSSKW